MDIIYILLFLSVCGGSYAYWHYNFRELETSYAEDKLKDARGKFKYFMNKMSALPNGLSERRRIPDFRKSADDIEAKLKNKKIDAERAVLSYTEIIEEMKKVINI